MMTPFRGMALAAVLATTLQSGVVVAESGVSSKLQVHVSLGFSSLLERFSNTTFYAGTSKIFLKKTTRKLPPLARGPRLFVWLTLSDAMFLTCPFLLCL
mmetsp:Transcript_47011/g.71071  ORF Transcript_47011/g.71071 Transcript_47011/m.71071 type:complete len:99 (+) Transcript_47011:76-372(+)